MNYKTCQLTLISIATCIFQACGNHTPQTPPDVPPTNRDQIPNEDPITQETIPTVNLAMTDAETAIDTVVVGLSSTGLALQQASDSQITWSQDLTSSVEINGRVKEQKYLRVTDDLEVPTNAGNAEYDIGCVYLELRDNVTYGRQTWLRMATTGIGGLTYPEVKVPLHVQREQWLQVPVLNEALSLTYFSANQIKRFDGRFCFRLDYSDAPAQDYKGQVVFQYLIADLPSEPMLDDIPPKGDDFSCGDKPYILQSDQSIPLTWSGQTTPDQLAISLASDHNDDDQLGSYQWSANGKLIYTAPDTIDRQQKVFITAKPLDDDQLAAFCEITLIPDETFVVEDDGESRGLVGELYKLEPETQNLPDFSQMTPVGRVLLGNLDIAERRFSKGFPQVEDLYEWFGIRFSGRLQVPSNCQCEFKLVSDDGAIVQIDGQPIIDNDGIHPTQAATGQMNLEAGEHTIQVDYYQGPRYHIALQLLWRTTPMEPFSIIGPEFFSRP
jgi:hypothetical protein